MNDSLPIYHEIIPRYELVGCLPFNPPYYDELTY
jgi:hypothetical protein